MLDQLVKAVKLSPRFAVGIKTTDTISHFAAEEKMIEQHDGVNLALRAARRGVFPGCDSQRSVLSSTP